MPDSLAVRMSKQMLAGKNGNGPVQQSDWAWIIASLTPQQMRRIEAQAAEHDCSMLAVLRDWPEMFEPEDDG